MFVDEGGITKAIYDLKLLIEEIIDFLSAIPLPIADTKSRVSMS